MEEYVNNLTVNVSWRMRQGEGLGDVSRLQQSTHIPLRYILKGQKY